MISIVEKITVLSDTVEIVDRGGTVTGSKIKRQYNTTPRRPRVDSAPGAQQRFTANKCRRRTGSARQPEQRAKPEQQRTRALQLRPRAGKLAHTCAPPAAF